MARTLQTVTRAQWGLVTRRQALELGLSDAALRWRVTSGRWRRVHPGVFQTLPGRDDWQTTALAGLLHVGIPAALCGPSAGYLWGLVPAPGPLVHIVVPTSRRPDPAPGLVISRSRFALDRTDERAWPHRIGVDHTVFDLAQGQPLDRAVALVAKAVQSRRTTVRNLRSALELRPNQTLRTLLLEVLDDVSTGIESAAELRYLRDVERSHGLPRAEHQRPGLDRTVCDNDYEPVRMKVEVDGRLGHAGWSHQQRDGRRDRRHATGGWLTIRVFWTDVAGSPCETASDLAAIMASRGWRGTPRPCRRRGCGVSA
ncbi:putative AbiEi antitoxin of type IV toxin-antitoxin system [Terracoccus luteus]|uniref:Putative AbiEi antitoxin of type IV toxin-antitoxin system n=1 Tax=Terracoccus luteus TaxID=53356 RepID=A0A495XT47_9MICO|nr:type IV toxin-antitoxin system AbiEi family antitoxin domain-containing protein [Terracoccus luteus]RKT77690.1 putative AbiEi antitoxin of type IV toxin-antitoxin system [Terracoccus luteus]